MNTPDPAAVYTPSTSTSTSVGALAYTHTAYPSPRAETTELATVVPGGSSRSTRRVPRSRTGTRSGSHRPSTAVTFNTAAVVSPGAPPIPETVTVRIAPAPRGVTVVRVSSRRCGAAGTRRAGPLGVYTPSTSTITSVAAFE